MVIFQCRPILVSLVGLATRTYWAVTCSVGETFVLVLRSRACASLPVNTHSTIFSRSLFTWLLARKQKRVDSESPSRVICCVRWRRGSQHSHWGFHGFSVSCAGDSVPRPARPECRTILPRKGSWQPQLPIIQFADSIEAGLEVTLLRCSSVFSSSMEWETQCSSSTTHSPFRSRVWSRT